MFEISASKFYKIISKYFKAVGFKIYQQLVNKKKEYIKMKHLQERETVFDFYPKARRATDAILLQLHPPNGTMEEIKTSYSEKHHLCGLKAKFSVLPSTLAKGYPGSVAINEIFRTSNG